MKVGRDVRFSTVPEWLLYADVSAYAVRVWAVLDRKADSDSGWCEASLADVVRLARCSRNTVKKALAELEAVGALEVDRDRVSEAGDPDANAYMLLTSDPSRRDRGRSRDDLPRRSGDDLPVGHEATHPVGHDVTDQCFTKEERTTESPKANIELPRARAFAEFWSVYPRKVGKLGAQTEFDRRVKAGADPEEILDGVRRYREHVDAGGVESIQFVPHPSTWLHQGRWEDELVRAGPAIGRSTQALVNVLRRQGARRDGADGQPDDGGVPQRLPGGHGGPAAREG